MCEPAQSNFVLKKYGSYDFSEYLSSAKRLFAGSDYVLGNLETPVTGNFDGKPCPFDAPKSFLDAVKNVGINFVSTANNHTLDKGIDGIDKTIENLKSLGLDFSGTYETELDSEKIFIKGIGGIKVAILTCTYGTNSEFYGGYFPKEKNWKIDILRPVINPEERAAKSVKAKIAGLLPRHAAAFASRIACAAIPSKRPGPPPYVTDNVNARDADNGADARFLERLEQKIARAKQAADIVVLMPHMGGQYNPVPGYYQKKLMKRFANSGADIIVSSHSHTPLRLEKFPNGVYGAYSLGNFCFTPLPGFYAPHSLTEFGIALNVYCSPIEKKITGMTFSLVKTTADSDGCAKVVPVADLPLDEMDAAERELLEMENEHVVNRFRGGCSSVDIEDVYKIF